MTNKSRLQYHKYWDSFDDRGLPVRALIPDPNLMKSIIFSDLFDFDKIHILKSLWEGDYSVIIDVISNQKSYRFKILHREE